MPETTPLIKAALNLRGGAGFDVYFSAVQKFVISLDNFIEIAMWQKNRRCAIAHSSYETSPIMCFV